MARTESSEYLPFLGAVIGVKMTILKLTVKANSESGATILLLTENRATGVNKVYL